MNLVEFPIALLSSRTQSGQLSFRKERTIQLNDGSRLHQEWIVTGTPEYGLPQSCGEDVLIGVLKIGTEDGFESPVIHFTRRHLLSVIGWSNDGRNHKRLEGSLKRLATTKIHAKNSFWNNTAKSYETVLFGIIDSIRLFERRAGEASTSEIALRSNWVRLSEEFYSSIQAGYIKPLDTQLYYGLRLAISRRLYRFLDKKRYRKERFEIGIVQLASVHVGLSETKCRFPSWIKQQLDPSHEELKAAGFLTEANYSTGRDGQWKVSYEFGKPARAAALKAVSPLVEALMGRGLAQETALGLVREKSEALIQRQLDVFDYLNQPRVGTLKNPAGFLKKAIEEEWDLKPAGFRPRSERKAATVAAEPVEAERTDEVAPLLAGLSPEEVAALQSEALAEAQKLIGPWIKLKADSPVVESVMGDLVRQRLAKG